MNIEGKLKAAIESKVSGSTVRAAMASGMWIIEVVDPRLNETNRKNLFITITDSVTSTSPGSNIWKILVYSNSNDRFSIEATLHTIPRTFSKEGFVTISLAANDCFLMISEFDSEVLQMEKPSQFKILGVEYKNSAGQKIMPFQEANQDRYQNIEFMGMMFNLDGSKIARDPMTGLIQIEIQ